MEFSLETLGYLPHPHPFLKDFANKNAFVLYTVAFQCSMGLGSQVHTENLWKGVTI